jgi:hypothetical protein
MPLRSSIVAAFDPASRRNPDWLPVAPQDPFKQALDDLLRNREEHTLLTIDKET